MTDFVFNAARGRYAHYASLPGAADALIVVLLEAAGLEADATLRDHDTLAALLAGSSNEQTGMGRKAASGVTVTVDDATDSVTVDIADVTWTSAIGSPVGKLLVCYDPDTTSGTDAEIIPLSAHDFMISPDGADVTARIDALGIIRETDT
ncbi:hypothetical protein ACFUGD_01770 [Streptomyces sp. NPDC057217]|uniref:hypothetical protein n=1 Tax=Streptomyces sp. NPDC057217 TaxID=3346054 RepID=UPI003635889C